jgi:putative addiction module antidote
MHALKLTQIGNSVGVILPREMLAKLGVTKGDTIYATNQPTPPINPMACA